VVGAEYLAKLWGDPDRVAAVAYSQPSQDVVGERCEILRSLAQGRHRDRDYVQPKEEILPEAAGRYLLLQVAVRSGEDAGVDRDAVGEPDVLIGEKAKQLALELPRDVTHLVEEEGAPERRLQPGVS
jgi:hypothetical protein